LNGKRPEQYGKSGVFKWVGLRDRYWDVHFPGNIGGRGGKKGWDGWNGLKRERGREKLEWWGGSLSQQHKAGGKV